MDKHLFALRLRELRRRSLLTQGELAAQVGVNWRVVQRWEHGRAMPRASNLRRLCEVFGLAPRDLIEDGTE